MMRRSGRRPRRWLSRAWALLVLTPALWLAGLASARADDDAQAPPAALAWMEIADSHGISAWDYDMSLDRGGVTSPGKVIWSFLIDLLWQGYRLIVGAVVWLIDWTLSFEWLGPLETPAQALSNSFADVIDRFGLTPVLLTAAAFVALIYLVRGALATGVYELLMVAFVAALAIGVFANPLSLVSGNDGWLAMSRDLGLQVGGALRADGQTADGDPEEVRETISTDLVDIFVRLPHQLVNYNTILDGTECEDVYDAAIQMSHATWVPGTVNGVGGEEDAQPGFKLVDSNGDPLKLPPGSDLGDLYDIADDKVAFHAVDNDVPDARDVIETCDEAAAEAAANPGPSQVANGMILAFGGLFLAVFALVLCGGVWVSTIYTMWLSVKALWQLVTGVLPGGQRLALMRTAADVAIALALVVFAMVFLVAYLQLVRAVFLEMDGSPTKKFAVLDILLIAGVIVYWRIRRRAKASGDRLASALNKRPGASAKALPQPNSQLTGAAGLAAGYALHARQAAESTGGRAGGALRRSAASALEGKDLGPRRWSYTTDGLRPLPQGGRGPQPPRGAGGGGGGTPSPGGGTSPPSPGNGGASSAGPGAALPFGPSGPKGRRRLPPAQEAVRRAKRDGLRATLAGAGKRPRIAGEPPPGAVRREVIRKANGQPPRNPDRPIVPFKKVVRGGRKQMVPRDDA